MNTAWYRRSPVRARVLAASLLLAVIGAVAAVPVASAAPLSHASPVSAARPGQPASGGPPPGVVSWSVAPATAKAADSRTRFVYPNIEPGSFIFDHVAVFNRSRQAVAFSIYATDATGTTASGVLTLLQAGKRSRDIGAWTTISGHHGQLSIIIPGGKGIIVPFTIKVPRRATPGDHIGGMIAAVGVPHRTPNGTLVTLYQRIAVPMELRVTGKLLAALKVESVSCGFNNPFNPFGGGSARVTYSVVNTGNVMLAGTQVVTVTGPFGAKSTIRVQALPTVLPGDSVQYTVSAGGLYPAGSISAHVTITPRWPADATPLPVSLASASASAFALPWALLVLIIVLAGGGYGSWRVVRTRRRAHEAEIAAAADRARRETERRLLGGANGKSAKSAKPAAKTAPNPAAKTAPNPAAKTAPNPAANAAPEPAIEAAAEPGTEAAATTTTGTSGGPGQPE